MSNFTRPVASSFGGVEFGYLSAEDIKAISVKRIHIATTLDSFNNPIPGGLYDPALGAWSDHVCSTCQMNSWSCPGHSGHIELPVPVYHVMYMDQVLRLLRAQCVYCHRLRMPRLEINRYACMLKLLQFGLVAEAETIRDMQQTGKAGRKNKGEGEDITMIDAMSEEEEDPEDFMDRRNAFVRKSIRRFLARKEEIGPAGLKSPAAAEARRALVKEFMLSMVNVKKCSTCKGESPGFRKDRYSKIFRKALPEKQRTMMVQGGFEIASALSLLNLSKQSTEKEKNSNGYADDDNMSVSSSLHGAEEEVAKATAALLGSTNGNSIEETAQQKFMPPSEVHACMTLLFEKESEIMDLLYNSRPKTKSRKPASADMFFIQNLLVPPNKYRPVAAQAGAIMEAAQNSSYQKIMKLCDDIKAIRHERQNHESASELTRVRGYPELLNKIVEMQDAVNSLIDSDKNPVASGGRMVEEGIKQKLEKKEGLFRMNMMGKRVNFAARSVISPDPNIETNEIGIPMVFAKKLTYPEPVTNHNFWELKEAVINGPDKYPGASHIENELGQVINLRLKTLDERIAIANQLLAPSNWRMKGSRNKKVHRHLLSGDIVIMNRQPTLHKPSMMGHRARVLPGEKTIRMHYANCNTYNADFDGDEMNMHFPQNELARSEAMQIADTDHQYLVATSGKPLRGLIQDHISMGTWFTSRDSFFDQDDYMQLLYSCLRPEHNHIMTDRIQLVAPAVIKPKKLWTGKQIITTVLKNIQPPDRQGLNLTGRSQTKGNSWAKGSEEGEVIFKDGELLCGIMDKAQLGPSAGGLIHSIHEAYGHTAAGKLLSILGRLLTKFLHMRAWTCGMDDLGLTAKGNATRRELLQKTTQLGLDVASQYVTLDEVNSTAQEAELNKRLEEVLREDEKQAGLDGLVKTKTAALSSEITSACLPDGLVKPFPWNQMQAMTTSGAKGSIVNANQISCNLGQQVLEGRRVPVMISGKTLPSFRPFETNVLAGGYVSGRFLTGIQPQEYYFHAMAGREGLIDTAVKTSRSGYLQRCLIKGMEGLRAEYDSSVREQSDGSVIQFLYGEDGLEITKQKHLRDFKFMAENYLSVMASVNVSDDYPRLVKEEPVEWHKTAMKKVKKTGRLDAMDPALAHFPPGANLGSTSESFAAALKKYEESNPDKVLKDKKKNIEGILAKKTFEVLMNMKYLRSVIEPGEAVGVVAGQSVGEPSTQMTLNTFHLAGHSAKNVTLGIPRLREIVMTASADLATPTMTLVPNPELSDADCEKFAKGISKLTLSEVVDTVTVEERIGGGNGYEKAKIYDIKFQFFPREEYQEEYAILMADLLVSLEHRFVPLLLKATKKELKKKEDEKKGLNTAGAQPEIGVALRPVEQESEQERPEGAKGPEDTENPEDDPESDNDEDADDAKQSSKDTNRSGQISYENPDDEEEEIRERQASLEPDSDDEDEARPQATSSRREVEDEDDEDFDDHKDEGGLTLKERETAVMERNEPVTKFKFNPEKSTLHLQLTYDIRTPKLLLLPIVENAIRASVIQHINLLGSCTFIPGTATEPRSIITEGVNLQAMREYQDVINPNSIYTNSIAHMLRLYGVEAARASIIKEMDAVFSGHSISVDNRHLNLIADAMTQSGGYKAFNRNGLVKEGNSPFMKMSFETTVGFLRDAILDAGADDLTGPSARIVVGKRSGVGTGAFEVYSAVA